MRALPPLVRSQPKDISMPARAASPVVEASPDLYVVFDTDLSAFDAALSEGWHLPEGRRPLREDPTLEPCCAALRLGPRPDAAAERIAA